MPIHIACNCGKKLSVKDELAGKRGKCPACGTMLAIPQPAKPAEPEYLGLAPLDDDEKPVPPKAPTSKSATNKPTVNAAKTTATKPTAASHAAQPPVAASKTLGGPEPAPLDLAPLAGGEEHNHSSWIDEGAETLFKVAGAPLSSATGQISAPPPSMRPVVHEEREGELRCPHCGDPLKRTVTVIYVALQMVLAVLLRFYFVPTAPYKCRRCGPIQYEELNGPSRRAADKRASRIKWGCLWIVLLTIGFGAVSVFMANVFRSSSRSSSWPSDSSSKTNEQWVQDANKNFEDARKRSEQLRREAEERMKKMRGENKQPAKPGSNPSPRPGNPTAPLITPKPTPMPSTSPFEETTLPPMPPPKPMPVNPFQPVE